MKLSMSFIRRLFGNYVKENSMKRALLSVSDKTNLVDFAKKLVECGYEIIATGGTMNLLKNHGVKVINIEAVSYTHLTLPTNSLV